MDCFSVVDLRPLFNAQDSSNGGKKSATEKNHPNFFLSKMHGGGGAPILSGAFHTKIEIFFRWGQKNREGCKKFKKILKKLWILNPLTKIKSERN